jgi:hypothetical protein
VVLLGHRVADLPITIQASIPLDNQAAGVSAMPRRVAAGRIARKRKIVSAEMSSRRAPTSASDGIADRLAERPSRLLAARTRLQLSLDSPAQWTCLALAIDSRNDRSLPAIITNLSQALVCRAPCASATLPAIANVVANAIVASFIRCPFESLRGDNDDISKPFLRKPTKHTNAKLTAEVACPVFARCSSSRNYRTKTVHPARG